MMRYNIKLKPLRAAFTIAIGVALTGLSLTASAEAAKAPEITPEEFETAKALYFQCYWSTRIL